MRVALAGKLGAGKNTVFEILKEIHGELREEKFAAPLYVAVSEVQQLFGETPHKDGRLLQLLGEHYRAKCGSDFFAKWLVARVKNSDNFCITDLRFPDEFEHAKRKNIKIIKIVRDENLRAHYSAGRDLNHSTEVALDNYDDLSFDAVINNNGGLDELKKIVGDVYIQLFDSGGN
ncbi:deoxynucleotide monophosphate kinase family protein [Fluviispira vulneris]|uniref:deoxynucleotide monophosphate kinase family protein n=1 Tax=Fluviispira vulneris TaxID=2763012 RepID=UPI001645458A|nr:hypothetical protein [Fluviispira vulneris]